MPRIPATWSQCPDACVWVEMPGLPGGGATLAPVGSERVSRAVTTTLNRLQARGRYFTFAAVIAGSKRGRSPDVALLAHAGLLIAQQEQTSHCRSLQSASTKHAERVLLLLPWFGERRNGKADRIGRMALIYSWQDGRQDSWPRQQSRSVVDSSPCDSHCQCRAALLPPKLARPATQDRRVVQRRAGSSSQPAERLLARSMPFVA